MLSTTRSSCTKERTQIIVKGIKGWAFSVAKMDSAYKQISLEKRSQRLKNFVIEGQWYFVNAFSTAPQSY